MSENGGKYGSHADERIVARTSSDELSAQAEKSFELIETNEHIQAISNVNPWRVREDKG
jgi:hypothetical protein